MHATTTAPALVASAAAGALTTAVLVTIAGLVAYAMYVAAVACLWEFLLVDPVASLAQPAPVCWLALADAVFSTAIPVFTAMVAATRIGA